MRLRIELKRVRYRVRGIPTERTRIFFDIDDHHIGSLTASNEHAEQLVTVLEAGARACGFTMEIFNDPRRHRPGQSS